MKNRGLNLFKESPYFLYALLVSVFAQGIALKWFLINSHLAIGGLSGICVGIVYILEKYLNFKISYAVLTISFNIPLIVLSYKKINKKFAFWSALNIICSGIIVDTIPVVHLSNDILANTLIGSVIFGSGTVFALKAGLSTGGSDILGVYMAKKGLGSVGLYSTVLTIIAFTLTFATTTPTIMIYSILSMLILNILIDKYYDQSSKVTMLIVSDQAQKINYALQRKMHRGSTIWEATGGYEKKNKNVILMTISTDQKPLLKKAVNKIDKNAFVIGLKTETTFGEWTSRLGERKYTKKDLSFFDEDDIYEKID